MKNNILFLFLVFSNLSIFAKSITPEIAQQVAAASYYQKINLLETVDYKTIELELTHTEYSGSIPLYYIFNRKNTAGFIIISGNDALPPIYAYSFTSNFTITGIPIQIKTRLNSYREKQLIAVQTGKAANATITKEWENKSIATLKSINDITSIGPLVTTTWDQGEFYNKDCPGYFGGPAGHAQSNAAGVALAQLMKYHEYPTNGTGSHDYYHFQFGQLSANFGAATYKWSQMPTKLTAHNAEVAEIIYHAAIAMRTCFALPSEARTYFNSNLDQELWGEPKAALTTYFDFSSDATYEYRSSQTNTQWANMLTEQLDQNLPVLLFGNIGINHHWICDGYLGNDFHLNFGLNGQYDGYYAITDNGTGEYALTNIYPSNYSPTGINETGKLNKLDLTVSPNPFSTNATVTFSLQEEGNSVDISLLTITGEVIGKLNRNAVAGENYIQLSDFNLDYKTGIYFISINSKEGAAIKRIISLE